MKNHILYLFALIGLIVGLNSCEDNSDFTKLHKLTDDEIAEIKRQDSIKEAQLTGIKADLILKYDISIKMSATLYDGGAIDVDLNSIANLFGISTEDLLAGIDGESGAPEIKAFAIEGTTHDDNGIATNTNAPWGHWWTADGDVTTWGASAYVFTEFDSEDGKFYVGQYPGRLTAGQKITIIEALRYNGKRAALQITISAAEKEEIKAQVVSTQELTTTVFPKSSYDVDPVEFDLAKALTDLGVESMDDVEFVAVNQDGTYASEYTGDASLKSYWFDMDGYVGSWGDNASVYATYGDLEENQVGIGQFPGHLSAGDEITIQYGILANNKIVMLKIKIVVAAYQDPETELDGDVKHTTHNITLTKPLTTGYESVDIDVKEMLRDAFRKTTYQIHQAIVSGDLKIYIDEVTEENPEYTGDAPGYWLKEDGTAGTWGESVVWCSLGSSETELYLYGGNHPENAAEATSITTKYIVTFNGGSVTFNINFSLTNE